MCFAFLFGSFSFSRSSPDIPHSGLSPSSGFSEGLILWRRLFLASASSDTFCRRPACRMSYSFFVSLSDSARSSSNFRHSPTSSRARPSGCMARFSSPSVGRGPAFSSIARWVVVITFFGVGVSPFGAKVFFVSMRRFVFYRMFTLASTGRRCRGDSSSGRRREGLYFAHQEISTHSVRFHCSLKSG